MPRIALWKADTAAVAQLSIEQVVATAVKQNEIMRLLNLTRDERKRRV